MQTAVTAPALVEFLKEFEGMVGGAAGRTAKELDFCKKYLTRGYPAGFETPSQVATQLETLVAYQLPDDYFNTVRAQHRRGDGRGRAARGEEVPRAWTTWRSSSWATARSIEPELRKLPAGKDLAVYQFDEDFRLVPAE